LGAWGVWCVRVRACVCACVYMHVYVCVYVRVCARCVCMYICVRIKIHQNIVANLSRHSTEGVLSSKNIHISQTLSSKFSLGIAKLSFQIVQLNLRIA